MDKTTVLDNDYATLWAYPDQKIVRHEFHRFIHGEEFRQVMEKGLEVFKQTDAQKWLSDDRKNSALPTEDLVWGLTEWSPRVFDCGWKYWAIVMPDKVAGQMNMNRIMKEYIDRGLKVQVFSDPDEALNWLKAV